MWRLFLSLFVPQLTFFWSLPRDFGISWVSSLIVLSTGRMVSELPISDGIVKCFDRRKHVPYFKCLDNYDRNIKLYSYRVCMSESVWKAAH